MRILMRASQTPFDNFNAFDTMMNDKIWDNAGNLLYANSIYKTLYNENVTIELFGGVMSLKLNL